MRAHWTRVIHYPATKAEQRDGWGIECQVCGYACGPFGSFEEADSYARQHEAVPENHSADPFGRTGIERMDTEEIRLVVEHLRRLPVWNRMVLMGMEERIIVGAAAWVEAERPQRGGAGGSESQVVPGLLADEERSVPPAPAEECVHDRPFCAACWYGDRSCDQHGPVSCICGHLAAEHDDSRTDCTLCGCLMVETEESHGY